MSFNVLNATPKSYLQQRLDALEIKEGDNLVYTRYDCFDSPNYQHVPVFSENKYGDIKIMYVGLNFMHTYLDGKSKKEKPYIRLRKHPERCIKGPKYLTPKGAGTRAFFPPWVINLYRERQQVNTLVITEGEFSAFKACLHNVPCIGLQGIHNAHEATEYGQKLDSEIELFIKSCQVKNIVLLFDSDCLEVTYNEEKDLFKRPNTFYAAVRNFRENTKHLNCDVYFAHVLPSAEAKGIDDLYVKYKNAEQQVSEHLLSLKSSEFFSSLNITDKSLRHLKSYFRITNVLEFYEAYQSIITDKPFIYHKRKYQFNGERLQFKSVPQVSHLFRIGDKYYEKVEKPSIDGTFKLEIKPIEKQTILDDYRKRFPDILELINKYKGFCNVPGHFDAFKQIIETPTGNWYNSYQPLPIEPKSGNMDQSLAFVKHVFGEQFELGLDYLQLLLSKPAQPQYVLCLVNEANISGKNTFADWLRILLGNNVTLSSSQDFEDTYNDDYISKLVVVIDESEIKKTKVKNYIKTLATGKTAKVNAKFVNRYEVEIFIKLIILSNDEEEFLKINKEDTRFWVRKVPKPEVENVNILQDLAKEAPAFLHFMLTREMFYPEKKSRLWFPPEIIRTDALQKVIEANRPALEVDIEEYISDMLLDFNLEQFHIDAKNLVNEINKISKYRHDIREVRRFLKRRNMKLSAPVQFSIPYYIDSKNGSVELSGNVHVGRVYTFTRSDWLREGTPEN